MSNNVIQWILENILFWLFFGIGIVGTIMGVTFVVINAIDNRKEWKEWQNEDKE